MNGGVEMLTPEEEKEALDLYVKCKNQIKRCDECCNNIEQYFIISKPRRAVHLALIKGEMEKHGITATDEEISAVMTKLSKGETS
jgi:hypothetical protein